MKFKTIGDKISLALALIGIVLILYGLAYSAVINRIVGNNVIPGWGLRTDGDSTEANATVLGDSMMTLFSDQQISGNKNFTAQCSLATPLVTGNALWINYDGPNANSQIYFYHTTSEGRYLQWDASNGYFYFSAPLFVAGMISNNGIIQAGNNGTDGTLRIYSEQGGTDYQMNFMPHAAMTQTTNYYWPANDGDASQFLQTDGAGNLIWATASGSGDITDVYNCQNGDANQLTIQDNEYLDAGAVDGTTDPYLALPRGNDVSTVTEDGRISWDSDNDRLYVGSGAATLGMAKLTDFADSIWVQDFWSPQNFSLDTVSEAAAGVYIKFPLTIPGTPTHFNVVRCVNQSGSNDQKVVFTFEGRLPGGFQADIDSGVFSILTSNTDTLVTKVNILIYGMNDQSGYSTADTVKYTGNSYASASANVWRWITVTGGSINPIAKLSDIIVHVECTMDNGHMVEFEGPDRMGFWARRK